MKIISVMKNRDFQHSFLLIALCLCTRLYYFLDFYHSPNGFPNPPDTIWYLERARALLESLYVKGSLNGIFYLGYYGLLALLLLIFKSKTVIILIQVLINAFSVIYVYKIGTLLFNKRAGFYAGIFYAFTWQIIHWSVFLLTDSLFVTVLLAVVYYLLGYHYTNKKIYIWMFFASSLYMMILRPTGLISAIFISAYILLFTDMKMAANWIKQNKIIVCSLLACFISGIAILFFTGVLNTLYASFMENLRWLLHSNYASGQLFGSKSPYDYKYEADRTVNYFNSVSLSFLLNNWYHILVIYLKRSVMFWAVWVWYDGPVQIQNNIQYFIPAYTFAIVGLINIVRKKLLKQSSILLLSIASIKFFCIIFFISVSFRYRAPSLAFLDILAGFGLDSFITMAAALSKTHLKHFFNSSSNTSVQN